MAICLRGKSAVGFYGGGENRREEQRAYLERSTEGAAEKVPCQMRFRSQLAERPQHICDALPHPQTSDLGDLFSSACGTHFIVQGPTRAQPFPNHVS